MPNPDKNHFNDSSDIKREENSLASLLKDCRSMLDKKTNVL